MAAWPVAAWVLAGLLSTSCGNRVPPPGGPVDESPPRIVSLEPDSNSVEVSPRARIRIVFDEEITVPRGSEGVRLSPVLPGAQSRNGWDDIELRPGKGFLAGCTYCVHLSGEIVDLRGNKLGEPLTFCFSTGDSLDRGIVRGEAGPLEGLGKRIIFQATHLPDLLVYRTEVDAEGSFSLTHLPRGAYRFLVFSDKDRNGRYDPPADSGWEQEGELAGETLQLRFDLSAPE
jgi:hypothetical protein